jgi:hypothetical protein
VELWEALSNRLNHSSTKFGRTKVLRKFTISRPSPDDTVIQYFTEPMASRKKLICINTKIAEDAMNHISSLPYQIHMKPPSKTLNNESPLPWHSSVLIRSMNILRECL